MSRLDLPIVEHIDHTADVGIRVLAATPEAAFIAAAEAMLDMIVVNRDAIAEAQSRQVGVEADGWEELLVAWLEELLYELEVEHLVPSSIVIRELSSDRLHAELRGESFDPDQHESGIQIKAVTYHQLVAEERDQGFQVQVIFDI